MEHKIVMLGELGSLRPWVQIWTLPQDSLCHFAEAPMAAGLSRNKIVAAGPRRGPLCGVTGHMLTRRFHSLPEANAEIQLEAILLPLSCTVEKASGL